MAEALMNQNLFQVSSLGLVMSLLVLIVGLVVTIYSLRYMSGDSEYKSYFLKLISLLISLICMFNVDNILAFISCWALSNLFLLMLMVHKSAWRQALEMGVLAGRNFCIGLISFLLFMAISFSYTQTFSIHDISLAFPDFNPASQALLFTLLLITAVTQSAQIPFHGWLLSSVNSPTPVSALMHAGLVNGGGYLLIKFFPLLLLNKNFLLSIFLIGAISAFIGILWLFIKSSVKGTLVSSTISQMGFMFMQIGLGLFPAAISHLCMHGFFKAFHFLSASSVFSDLKIKNLDISTNLVEDSKEKTEKIFLFSLLIAAFSLIFFSVISHYSLSRSESSFLLLLFIFMAFSEFSYATLVEANKHLAFYFSLLLSLILNSIVAILYGSFLKLFEYLLAGSIFNITYQLAFIHYFVASVFFIVWFSLHFKKRLESMIPLSLQSAIYTLLMNSSRSHPLTNTAIRGDYRYK